MAKKATVHYIDVDTTEAEQQLKQLKEHSQITAMEVVRQTHKGYTAITLIGGILGYIVPAWFNMMANAVFGMAQTMLTVSAAETLSGIGLLKASFTFAASALLFAQALLLLQQKDVADREINNTIALLNLYGGLGGI
jgi:hypothetical protein